MKLFIKILFINLTSNCFVGFYRNFTNKNYSFRNHNSRNSCSSWMICILATLLITVNIFLCVSTILLSLKENDVSHLTSFLVKFNETLHNNSIKVHMMNDALQRTKILVESSNIGK